MRFNSLASSNSQVLKVNSSVADSTTMVLVNSSLGTCKLVAASMLSVHMHCRKYETKSGNTTATHMGRENWDEERQIEQRKTTKNDK